MTLQHLEEKKAFPRYDIWPSAPPPVVAGDYGPKCGCNFIPLIQFRDQAKLHREVLINHFLAHDIPPPCDPKPEKKRARD